MMINCDDDDTVHSAVFCLFLLAIAESLIVAQHNYIVCQFVILSYFTCRLFLSFAYTRNESNSAE